MKTTISNKKLREFGIVFGTGLPFFVGWIIPLINQELFKIWTLFIGFPIFLIGILKPKLLIYPYKFWFKIGSLLGLINSRLVLGLIFIVLLQPLALIMKCFRYDPLKKNKNRNKSYREDVQSKIIDLKRIF